jgi:hypothetical protein
MLWSSDYGTIGPKSVYLFGVHEIQNNHAHAEEFQGEIYAVVHVVVIVFGIITMIEFVDFLFSRSASTSELE